MAAVTLIGMDMHLEGGLFTVRSIGGTHEFQMIEARTMGFTILVFAQLFNAIASRSARQSAFVGLFSNKWLWGAIGLSVVLQLVVIYVPFLNSAFGTTPLGPWAWVECICLAAVVLKSTRRSCAPSTASAALWHNNATSLHRRQGSRSPHRKTGALLIPRNR